MVVMLRRLSLLGGIGLARGRGLSARFTAGLGSLQLSVNRLQVRCQLLCGIGRGGSRGRTSAGSGWRSGGALPLNQYRLDVGRKLLERFGGCCG